jgi:signal transduction histidine kinase
MMRPRPFHLYPDTIRDAHKYRALLNAIDKATSALRAFEQGNLALDWLLKQLLDPFSEALMADGAFVAQPVTGVPAMLELIHTFPNPALVGSQLPLTGRLSQVLESGQPIVINHHWGDPAKPAPELSQLAANAAVLVRMATASQSYLIGVYKLHETQDDPFLAPDYKALGLLVDLLTAGMRARERTQRERELIRKNLNQLISKTTVELAQFLPEIAHTAADLLHAPAASVMLWSADHKSLEVRGKYQLSEEEAAQVGKLPGRIVQSLLREVDIQRPIVWENLQKTRYARFLGARSPHLHIGLCVPLRIEGELIGTLIFYERQPGRHFHSHELELAQIFADEIVVAVHSAELYQRNQQQLSLFQALYQASWAIAKAGVERNQILQAILAQAVSVTSSAFGALRLVDQPNSTSLDLVAVYPPERYKQVAQVCQQMDIEGRGIAALAFRQNAIQIVPDVTINGHFWDTGGLNTGSAISVVLRRSGEETGPPIGVLTIQHREANVLNPTFKELMLAFANLVAVVVQNATQYDELIRIKQELASTRERDLFDLAHAVVHRLGNSVGDIPYQLHRIESENRQWRSATVTAAVEHIQQRINSLADLMEPLRDLANLSEVTFDTLELGQIIRDGLSHVKANRGIVQCINLPNQPVWVNGNYPLLRDALQSVLENAYEAMGDAGQLLVDLSLTEPGWVQVRIADTGPGIDQSAWQRIFEPGFSTKAQPGQRRGKGLFTARAVLRKHGGKLEAVQFLPYDLPLGAVFDITLPLTVNVPEKSNF